MGPQRGAVCLYMQRASAVHVVLQKNTFLDCCWNQIMCVRMGAGMEDVSLCTIIGIHAELLLGLYRVLTGPRELARRCGTWRM